MPKRCASSGRLSLTIRVTVFFDIGARSIFNRASPAVGEEKTELVLTPALSAYAGRCSSSSPRLCLLQLVARSNSSASCLVPRFSRMCASRCSSFNRAFPKLSLFVIAMSRHMEYGLPEMRVPVRAAHALQYRAEAPLLQTRRPVWRRVQSKSSEADD